MTALAHFVCGFLVIAAITFLHAHRLGETNGSFIGAGIASGIVCATVATFVSEWATPAVLVLVAAAAHREYLDARRTRSGPMAREDAPEESPR